MRAFAVGGAIIFGASLGWFAFQYFITFAGPVAGIPDARAIAVDAGLFTAFALHHSAFARTWLRNWVMSYAPRSERSIYVWTASLLFIAVCTAWQPIAGVAWNVGTPWPWILKVPQIFAVVLIVRGVAALNVRSFVGLSAATQGQFVTRWPYGWIRHPIYLGWFLLVWPLAQMTATQLVFAVVSSVYVAAAIPLEERTISKASGGAYDAYKAVVKWRLVPGIY